MHLTNIITIPLYQTIIAYTYLLTVLMSKLLEFLFCCFGPLMFNHIVPDCLTQWPTLANGHCVPQLNVPMETDQKIVNKGTQL